MSEPPTVDAIRLSPDDNVATVLRDVAAGETLRVRAGADLVSVTARDAIPMCHKVSLAPIPAEAPVVKYGQRIGSASGDIAEGRHVHVHSMHSDRGRRAPAG